MCSVHFEPEDRVYNGTDMTGLRSFNNSMSKRVLYRFETGKLRLRELA